MSGFLFGAHELMTAGWLIGIGISVIPAVWFGAKNSVQLNGLITLLGVAEVSYTTLNSFCAYEFIAKLLFEFIVCI